MCRFLILFVASFLFISCAEQVKMEDRYVLQPVDNYLEYAIDDETVVPLYNLYIFKDNGEDFLTFSNPLARTILIYNLHSGELVKKLSFEREGPNGVGGHIFGYYIKDFNHIFLPSAITTQIYLTDTTGVVKQKIDFSECVIRLKKYPDVVYSNNSRVVGEGFFEGKVKNKRGTFYYERGFDIVNFKINIKGEIFYK